MLVLRSETIHPEVHAKLARLNFPLGTKMKLALLSLLMGAAFSASAGSPLPTPVDQNYPGTIVMKLDASNTAQNIFRVTQSIPVKPGKMTLLYPQWVPANHGPSSPINQFAGLKISGNGKPIAWHRDNVNVFAFHLDVPAGVKTIDAKGMSVMPGFIDAHRHINTGPNEKVQRQQLLEAGIAFVPPSTWEGETVGRLAFLHPGTTMDVVRDILGRTEGTCWVQE